MPTYVYRCKRCNLPFETKQGYDDAPLEKCPDPDCRGKVERVMQPFSFSMKKEGWQPERQADGSRIYSQS